MKKTVKLIIYCFIILLLSFNISFSIARANENDSNIKEYKQQKDNFKLNTEISEIINSSTKNKSHNEIEKIFYRKNLKQYGYEIFNIKPVPPSTKTSENYKIKEGDNLNIYLWGDSIDLLNISANGFLSPISSASVNNQGNIYINGVGIIGAKGRTASDVEKIITNNLSQKIDNFKVQVNIANSGNFPVIITGNVKKPGTYYINNDFSPIEILSLAGGINKNGSLRNIAHISINKRNEIDLYDILIKGKSYNKEFKKEDIILVKPIGNIIGINEGVKRPAIYEFKKNETLKNLIDYAGGILPSVKKDIAAIETFDSQNSKKKTVKINFVDFETTYPHNGDLIKFETLFDAGANIEVSGCISKHGSIPYRENMTLKNVLNLVNFDKNSNIQHISNTTNNEIDINNIAAEISTIENGNPAIKSVYLYNLLTKNQQDITLKPEDKILFRELNENENLKTVEVLGYVKKPGILKLSPDMKLSDAIKIAGGVAKEGYLTGLILLRPTISEEQKQILEKAMLDLNKGILEVANKSQIVPNEDKNFLSNQKELVQIMEKKADKDYGRISLNIKTENPEDFSEQENITLQDGDKIYIPIKPQHIMIVGEVLNPSAIVFSKEKTLKNYIYDVGGLTKEADKRKIYISKANGFSQRAQQWNNVSLEPGDSVIIPRKISKPVDWFEFSKNFATVIANTLNTIFIITKI